jgi:hypothetical protein
VNQLAGTTCRIAGVLPCRAESHDPFAVAVETNGLIRTRLFQPFVLGKLALEDRLAAVKPASMARSCSFR